MDTSHIDWRGVHHVALVTRDLDATIAFYRDVLGMEVGDELPRMADGTPARHCFIKPGSTEGWGLHVFEHPEARLFSLFGDGEPTFRFLDGALQHIAFALPDEAAGQALYERLERHHVPSTGINRLGGQRNVIFADNNGMMVEATWPAA